ncbi:MAG: glucuronate isomerase [Planctomycetaceae bacterium]|jgi:glucuronate isomerase|nr:glucuronate isomerase [Planctomycetaceae bacterium]
MNFITENFLLQSAEAVQLYHEFAKPMPIIDYHCHLSPKEVAEDRRFENLTQIWLAGDHYKWRAMRAAGVDEKYITGDASDWEKFQAWAETVPKTLRNPLYHWTHLELKRPFGITDKLLCPATAKEIWNECNAKLQTPEFSARGIMRQMNVKLVCTTDDPADDLRWHKQIAADKSFDIQVLPTFRPDKAVPDGASGISDDYKNYIVRLCESAEVVIKTPDDLLNVLKRRHDYFHENGCRLSDHGFGQFQFYFVHTPEERAATLTELLTTDEGCSHGDIASLILRYIAELDFQKNWTMQLHIGAIRNNNTRMFEKIGRDAGFDSIMDQTGLGNYLDMFFNDLDYRGILPQTIVYNLNPVYNELIATTLGNFQGDYSRSASLAQRPSKMQFGSGWWFLDQKDGMERQLNCLSNLGLLSQFAGMLTDSRSFLSYTRHEYFRRILCNLLGQDMHDELLPNDMNLVGKMVQDICYNNAENYFGFRSC